MHRSGTSAVAGLLGALGCHLGEPAELHPADAWNPRGYWERREVWDLDERALQAAGACWHDVGAFELDRIPEDQRGALQEEAAAIVRRLDAYRPWAIKDPRLCLLLPLWRPALSDAIVVLVTRDPREVAASLRRRDALPIMAGIALWERYLRDALRHSTSLPRIVISYEDLCADPAEGARALLEGLERSGVPAGTLRLPSPDRLRAAVDSSLRHAGPDGESWLSGPQAELLDRLRSGAPGEPGPLSAPARDLLEALGELRRRDVTGVRLLEGILGEKDRWIAVLQQRLDAELPRLLEMLAEKDRWIGALQQRLDVELPQLREQLEDRERTIAALRAPGSAPAAEPS